jgi:hypothetical protein
MFKSIMSTKLLSVAMLAFLGTSANAATVIYGDAADYIGIPEIVDPAGIVIAIENLEIGGVFYNVDFGDPSYPTVGGNSNFWTTAGEATIARDTINSLLNSEAVGSNPVAVGTAAAPLAGFFSVYYGTYAGDDLVGGFRDKSMIAGSQWSADTFTVRNGIPSNQATAWSVVPVPGAVWLFGSGLGFLGWMRKRKIAA